MKRLLTPEFVNEVSPPEKGERWIADTKVRNFGLRLWATKSGGSKAYCLRLGSKKRLTFDPYWDSNYNITLLLSESYDGSLGSYLQPARNWARLETKKQKSIPIDIKKLNKENQKQKDYYKKQVSQLTLQEAAQSLLRGMEISGRTEAYRDQLAKLFHNWNADSIKKKQLTDITAEELADALVDRNYTWANIRALKAFITQIYKQASTFGFYRFRNSKGLGKLVRKAFNEKFDVKYPELRDLKPDVYREIFRRLEENTDQWQQAYCLRLYFEFSAPLSRLMAARWDQTLESNWYPYLPHEKKLWFHSREEITDEVKTILSRLSVFRKRDFIESDYWFPSKEGQSKPHITTISRLWGNTLKQVGIKHYPLYEFARSYREPHRPSYYSTYSREFIDEIFSDQIVAVMSKLQQLEKNKTIRTNT